MDVRYEIVDDYHGYFELRSCGALRDVEPWGERAITGMCHTIEDATFDPTAQAVNPRAHVSHVNRPPRMPADRVTHSRSENTNAHSTLGETTCRSKGGQNVEES